MVEKVIINTAGEDFALIPDRWVIGTGLTTNQLYAVHTAPPLMIIQYAPSAETKENENSSTVYVTGDVDPRRLNRLLDEAWNLLEIYKDRASHT